MANNNQYNDYEYDAYFGGSDFGGSNSAPSFDFGSDALDMDWGAIFDTTPDATDMDWGSLFDTSDATDMDWGSLFDTNDATDLDWGAVFDTTPSFDYSDTEGGAIGIEGGVNWADYLPSYDETELGGGEVGGILSGLPSPSQEPSGTNYLLEGVRIPGEGTQIPATSLYKTEEEVAEKLPSEGLKEPEMPGLSEMGGAQGTYVEVPTQFDEEGNRVPNTGGYVGSLGFVPYDAVPSLGDPRSWINRPDVLGKTVFGEDFIKSSDLTKGTTTTTTPSGTKTEKTTPVNTTNTKTIIDRIIETVKGGGKGGPGGATDKDTMQMLMALLGGLYGLYQGSKQKPAGYQGGIPKYTAQRNLGKGVTYTKAATGGLMDVMAGQPNENVIMMANGGLMGLAAGGRYLRGGTDGMADKLEANIDGKQPARLSHGEFVIPADVVSHLGNGNSEAGADVLYEMMAKVRKARTGNSKQGKEINPRKYTPA